jgi:hypothetical protein
MQELPNWIKNDGEDNFSSVLMPNFAGKPIKALQIGAYSGDASYWLAENVLKHKYTYLWDVEDRKSVV